ncbi:MAG: hypothetical protein E6J06_04090 [Chloroflexi bacterium]|nr:MAG: hypothetical protein E6J06_04090 [Chloroflexota bacterium]
MNTYYAANLLIYAGVDIIAVLALNLQFGVSGIVNFSFIVFQAAGAYAAAVLSMPPHTAADYSFQVYVGGYQLPFPIPWIGGALAGALLAIPVGLVVLRKLRSDYQAIALLVTSIIANTVINNARPFLNGAAGLALVPQPLENQVDTGTDNYLYLYIGLTAVCVGLVWFLAARIVNSPYGRTLRAMREHELAATALGKNPVALKMTMFIVGGALGALHLALSRDHHPVRRADRRRPGQQPGRDPGRPSRAGRLRGGHAAADPDEHRPPEPHPRARVGRDRPVHPRLSLVPARRRAARAASHL